MDAGAESKAAVVPESRRIRVAAQDIMGSGGFRSGVAGGDRVSPFAHLGYGVRTGGPFPIAIRAGVLYSADTTELTEVRLFAGDLDLCPVVLGGHELVEEEDLRLV